MGTLKSAIPPGRMKVTDVIKGQKCPMPHKPGVYRHIDKNTETVLYAGQTNDLHRRQLEHLRNGFNFM